MTAAWRASGMQKTQTYVWVPGHRIDPDAPNGVRRIEQPRPLVARAGMISSVSAPRPAGVHRTASMALGVAILVVAVLALATATWGPGSMRRVLAGGPLSAPPPVPAAVVSSRPGDLIQAGSAPINPATPVTVAVQHGTLRDVQVTDAKTGQPVAGALAPDAMSWHTTAALVYGGSYRVAATAVGADQQVVEQSGTVNTLRPAALTSAAFRPTGDSDTVGVGHPLVVAVLQGRGGPRRRLQGAGW